MKKILLYPYMIVMTALMLVALGGWPRHAQAFDYIICGAPTSGICGNGCKGQPCLQEFHFSNDYNVTLAQMTFVDQEGREENPELPESGECLAGDPVSVAGGQFLYQCKDLLVIPGRNMDVKITHSYNSGKLIHGAYGYGWLINYHYRLHHLPDGRVMILGPDGRKTPYTFHAGAIYHPTRGRFEVLQDNGDGTWVLIKAQGDEYHFDSQGRLASMNDRNNNTLTFIYSAQKEPVYGFSEFSNDPALKRIVSLDYRLEEIHDTNNRVIDLVYNTDGLLDRIIDNGREVVFGYDPNTHDLLTVTRPATAQYPAGVTKTFEYENHNVRRIADARDQYFVENFYDAQGRVFRQNLGGHDMFFDYSVPRQTTFTDRNGNVKTMVFNAAGNLMSEQVFTRGLRVDEPASYLTTYTYNADSLQTSVTFPRGNGIKTTYDETNPDVRARGNVLEIRRKTDMAAEDNDMADIVVAMTYEPQFNQVKQLTDAKSRATTHTYDYELDMADPDYGTEGNLVMVEQPAVTAGVPITSFKYNDAGQVTKVTDPNDNVVDYTYYPATGYLHEIIQDSGGVGATTTFSYDSNGFIDTIIDPEDRLTDLDYNALGWLIKETNGLNYVTDYEHDQNGNVRFIRRQTDEPRVAANDQVTEFTYDVLNNLETITDPRDRVTTYRYDDNDNLESIIDAETNTTTYVYDERNLLFTVTDANTPAGVTTYDYDLNGNLAKITDAEDNATRYMYDLFDRLDIMTYADTSFVNYDYDKNSNLDFVTLPGAHGTIDYVYDELNRLTNKNFPNNPSRNMTFDYDLGSRLTDANNAAALIHYNYDALNRVDDVTQTLNGTPHFTDYAYEDNGNVEQIIYPSTKQVNYTYDDNNRLDLVKVGGVTLVDYNYDLLDRRDTKTFTNLSPQQRATYQFDIANQLSSITNVALPSTNISTHTYPTYDDVGNRKQYDRTFGANPLESIDYGYNDIYELTSVTGAQMNSYDYDNVGNREVADGVSYTPNDLNQYADVDGMTFGYDDNGNLTNDGTNTYTYDELNRLVSFTDGNTNASYTYDALNRRVSKTVDGVTTFFVYDNDSVIAEYDGAGSINAEYVLGGKIDEVLTMERGGNTYHYHYDGLGSVAELTDSTGAVVENYTYDAYGNITSTLSAVGNPYYFTGRRLDEESSIYYYRARQYDPTIGRFLQRDPIGYMDSMNLYQYVDNNPTNYTDPTGMAWWIPIIEGALLAYDTYELARTELDPCASDTEKNVVRAAWVVGATSFGGGATLAARRAAQEAAERAAKTSLKMGANKSSQKWANQMAKRGWTRTQVDEAFTKGQTFKAKNYVNPNNTATRYVHPKTGQSIVVDDVTKEVIHVGGPGFKY